MGDSQKHRPQNPFAIPTRERWRTSLPHWEVEGRAHFVTICGVGALPRDACERLRELNAARQRIEPRSREFGVIQRQYFLTAEKYLDREGDENDRLNTRAAKEIVAAAIENLPAQHGWNAFNWVIMPNHIHLLLRAVRGDADTMRLTLTRFKGRTARLVNQTSNCSGDFWQSEWFDRWARTDEEEAKVTEYIRQNPVKARIVSNWQDYEWVR